MADAEATPNGEDTQAVSLPSTPDVQATSEDFDKDRAMATIQKLRAFEKDAKGKLKRLEELEAQASEREQADLTAAQKLEKQLKALQAEHEQARTALRRATLKDAAQEAAGKANLTFAPGALSDALALGVFDNLEWADDAPRGMGAAVKELHASKPYLFVAPTPPSDIGATNKGKSTKEPDVSGFAARWGIKVN